MHPAFRAVAALQHFGLVSTLTRANKAKAGHQQFARRAKSDSVAPPRWRGPANDSEWARSVPGPDLPRSGRARTVHVLVSAHKEMQAHSAAASGPVRVSPRDAKTGPGPSRAARVETAGIGSTSTGAHAAQAGDAVGRYALGLRGGP